MSRYKRLTFLLQSFILKKLNYIVFSQKGKPHIPLMKCSSSNGRMDNPDRRATHGLPLCSLGRVSMVLNCLTLFVFLMLQL